MILAALVSYTCLTVYAPRDVFVDYMAGQFGEVSQAVEVKSDNVAVELFANPETRTWTVLMNESSGMSCVIGVGKGWHKPKGADL